MILVVDDHAAVARALVALASGLGYEATAVHGGREALEHVRRSPPALMLLDLHMPGISGFDVLRALREDDRFDSMPVVVCSAAPPEQTREKSLQLGAQDFLAKEDAAEELEGVLARQLGERKVQARGVR